MSNKSAPPEQIIDKSNIWYHGSPLALDTLATGSTITRNRELARVFSHKPELVVVDDSGRIRHTGRQPGYLYQVLVADSSSVYPHPCSSMPGQEWLTRVDLPLVLLEKTNPRIDELLSEQERTELLQKIGSQEKEQLG